MDNVIQMFPSQAPPVPDGQVSPAPVRDRFIDEHLHDFLLSLQLATEAGSDEAFLEHLGDARTLMHGWPRGTR